MMSLVGKIQKEIQWNKFTTKIVTLRIQTQPEVPMKM